MDRVKRGLHRTMLMSCGCALVIGSAAFLLARPLTGLFGVTGEAQEAGMQFLRAGAVLMPVAALYLSYSGVLRGAGDMTTSMCITGAALLMRTVATYVGAYLTPLGGGGTWLGLFFDWPPSLLMIIPVYYFGRWRDKAIVRRKTC